MGGAGRDLGAGAVGEGPALSIGLGSGFSSSWRWEWWRSGGPGDGGLSPELLGLVEAAAAVLREGGIVVYPTETLYALGARACDEAALHRLLRAKLRPLFACLKY